MEITILRSEDTLEIHVLGHTKTEFCNGISCLLWSLLAWAVNFAEGEHDFKSGDSYIRVKKCSPDIVNFMETAIEQMAYNNSEIVIKRGK